MTGYAIAAGGCGITLSVLSSMGTEAASPDGPDGAALCGWAAGATLALGAAFWSIMGLLQRENAAAARGRVISTGPHGRPLRFGSNFARALALALGCLGLTLLIMATLEVAARAVSDDIPATATRKVRDRSTPQGATGDADSEGEGERSSQGSGANRKEPGLIGPGTSTSVPTPEADSMRLGDLLSDVPALRVESRTQSPPAALHLRSHVLDTYAPDGTLSERRSAQRDMLTSGPGGWIQVAPKVGIQRDRVVELTVEYLRPSNGVVFAPTQLQAIQANRVQYDPASDIWILGNLEQVRYGVRCKIPELTLRELHVTDSRGSLPDASAWALPAAKEGSARQQALLELTRYARSITARAESDFHRTLAVVGTIRSTFGYELYDVSMLSPERCTELIERGSGSCTHFASLSAMLLRSLEIPARVAVGYVAEERTPDGKGWIVRSRDGHAWIEVHFQGYGWLPFDATPGEPNSGVSSGGSGINWAPVSESDTAIAEWAGWDEPGRQASAHTSALGDVIANAVERAVDSVKGLVMDFDPSRDLPGGGLLWALVLIAAASLVVVLWRRRGALHWRDGSAGGTGATGELQPQHVDSSPPLPEAQELMRALDARDLRQRVGETPSRFARSVEARHAESHGLVAAVRALIRRASTNTQLTKPQKAHLQALADRIRRGGDSRERDGSEPRP